MFETRLAEAAARVAARLDAAMAPMGDLPVVQAMRYASAGGKRLRAFLVLEGAALHDIGPDLRDLAGGGGRGDACLFPGP